MKSRSTVEYIGGQDENGKKLLDLLGFPPLAKNMPYMVSIVTVGQFSNGSKLALQLKEYPGVEFLAEMFREIEPNKVNENEDLLLHSIPVPG